MTFKMPAPFHKAKASWPDLFTDGQLKAAYQQGQESAYDAMFDAKGCKACRFDAQTAIRALIEKDQQS